MNNSQHFQEMFRRKVVNYSAVNHGRVQPATPFTAPAFLDTLQISMKTDKAFYPIDTKSVSMSLNNNNSKVLFLGEDYMVARKEDNQKTSSGKTVLSTREKISICSKSLSPF